MYGTFNIKTKVQIAHTLRNLHIPEAFTVYEVHAVKSIQRERERKMVEMKKVWHRGAKLPA